MSNIYYEKVTSVHHWNDTLFSFTCTRDPGLRFINGQFVMIGLEVEGRPLMRPTRLSARTTKNNWSSTQLRYKTAR